MTTVTFPNNNTYNDGSTPPGNMDNGGHRTNFIPLVTDTIAIAAVAVSAAANATAQAGVATTQATNATAQAGIATTAKNAALAAQTGAEAAATSTQFPSYTTSGPLTAYTITDANLIIAASACIKVKFHVTCGNNPTLRNISSGTAKPILYQSGQPISAGVLKANQSYILLFDAALNAWKVQGLFFTLIQQPEAIFPINSNVVSINPTRLQATPYAPLYLAGALVGNVAQATYQIASDAAFANVVHTITKSVAPFDNVLYNIGVLQQATTYYWRVKYQDTKGTQSEWSIGATFVTAASFLFDMLAFQHTADTVSGDNRLLTVYDVDVATYTKQDLIAPADKIIGGTLIATEWSPNGRFLLCGINTSEKLVIYDYGDGIPVKITLPAWLLTKMGESNVYIIKINKAANKIFIGLDPASTNCAICANWSDAGIGAEIILPSVPLSSPIWAADWSHDNNYLIFTTSSNSPEQQNSRLHVYAWVDGAGQPLANPIRLASPPQGSSNQLYDLVFNPRYNQFYSFEIGTSSQNLIVFEIQSNNTITYRGGVPTYFGSNAYQYLYKAVANVAGTRLYSLVSDAGFTGNSTIQIHNINQANATLLPTLIGGLTDFNKSQLSTIGNTLSVNPANNQLAVAPAAFPLGSKPRVYDVSNDTFVDMSNSVPFAYYAGTSSFTSYSVAYRFGRYGYPAGV